MPPRTLAAFLIAPGISPGILFLWDRFHSANTDSRSALSGFLFLAAITYAAAVVVGLPIYLWLARRNLINWWRLTLIGIIAGASASLIFGMGEFSVWSLVYIFIASSFGIPWGALTGFCFWLIAHAGQSVRLNA